MKNIYYLKTKCEHGDIRVINTNLIMSDSQLHDNIFLIATQAIQSGLSVEQIIDLILEAGIEVTTSEIDPIQLKAYLDAQLQPILQIRKSQLPASKKEMKSAVKNLLKIHEFKIIDETGILENTLYKLSEYDKLIEVNNRFIPVILSQLFDIFSLYIRMLKVHDIYYKKSDTLERTTALNSSNSTDKALVPLSPYMKKNIHNGAIKPNVYKNVVSAYIEDPYATDYALSAIKLFGIEKMKYANPEEIQALEFIGGYINSTLRVEKKDIINSLKITISHLYLKNSPLQKMLGLNHHLPQETLASCIDHCLGYIFKIDTKKKKTDHKKFKQPIQVRTHFDCVPLLEYVRKGKVKNNPIFEDTEFLHKFQEKIKVKISKI